MQGYSSYGPQSIGTNDNPLHNDDVSGALSTPRASRRRRPSSGSARRDPIKGVVDVASEQHAKVCFPSLRLLILVLTLAPSSSLRCIFRGQLQ